MGTTRDQEAALVVELLDDEPADEPDDELADEPDVEAAELLLDESDEPLLEPVSEFLLLEDSDDPEESPGLPPDATAFDPLRLSVR